MGEQVATAQESIALLEAVQAWRQQLIRSILRALTLLGLLALVAGSYSDYSRGNGWTLPIYLGVYAILVSITLWRRAPYVLQVGILLLLFYGLGVVSTVNFGLGGDGGIFLVVSALAMLLLGWQWGVLALVVCVLTMTAFGWMFSTALLTIPVEKLVNGNTQLIAWLSTAVVFLMLGALLILSQSYLFRRLLAALTKSHELTRELAADITERKRMEAALQESELRYRILFESAPIGIGLATLEGQILEQNDAMCRITGYSGAYLSQINLGGIYQNPEERAVLLKRLQADGFVRDFEVGLKRKDGTPYWASLTIARLTLNGEDVLLTMAQDVTERKQAEEALRQSEQRFRAMVEKGQETISIIGRDGIILYESPPAEHVLGHKSEELVGKYALDLIHPGEVRAMRELYAAALDQPGLAHSGECVLKHKDGSWRTMEFTVTNFLSDPAINGIIVNSRDITERKQAEKKLYEAEARYRTLVEQIPAITYIAALDEASTTLYISPQIETILGFSPAEYQAHPDMWRERLHPDDRERILAEVARSQAAGEPLASDYRMLTRDGRVVWFHDEATLVYDTDGRPLFLQGVMLDITERKRIETTLRESELRYRSLVETSPDAIALVDLDLRRLLCNRQDAVLHGYESTEEMIGGNILDLVAPEDLPRAMGYMRQGRETGSIRNIELTLLKKDGTRFAAEISGSVITNIDGQPQSFMTVLRDITGRKRAEEAIRQNEETARGLLNATTDSAFLMDVTGTILALNETTAQNIGKSPDELLGSCVYDLLAPDVAKGRRAQVDEVIRSGQSTRFEDESQGRWIANSVYPISDAPGRVARVAIYARDITEQRQTEVLLMRHAQEMEALYNTSLEINSQPDVPILLQAIVQRAAGLVRTQMGGLYLIKPDGQTLELVVSYNLPGDYLGVTLHRGEGLAGCVAQTGKPMAIEDYIHWEERAAAYANAPFRRVLGVPLRVRDTVIGVIDVVDDKTVGPFGEDEIRLVSLFADQAAIAIENARLYQAEREQRQLAETLREVGATLVSTLDANAVLVRILEQVNRVVPNDVANILLIEGDRARFAGWRGYERFGVVDLTRVTFLVAGTRNLQQMVETGEPVVIPDVHADPDWFHVPRTEQLRSYAGVPVRVRGETIGFLAVCSVTPGCFEWRDAERLRAFADQAAIALENARLYQAEREQRELAETMREISAALASTLDMDIVLDRLLANVSRIVPNEAADIMLVEGDHARFVRWRGYERFGIRDLAAVAFPIADRPHLQQMVKTCGPVFVSDTHTDPNWDHVPNMEWLRSYAGAPICVRGETIGFLDVASTQPGVLEQLHAERLRAFADQAAIALQNARLFEQVRDTANRLQALSHRLVETQETERRHIARELHDEIGQIVTGLKLRLEMSSRLQDDALRDSLGEAKGLVQELLERVRELSLDLRPAMLDDLGLLPAFVWLFEHFTAQANVGVAFKHSGVEHRRFSSEVETAAYRIVQEALTNVARHASASTVTVRLWATPDTLGVQVEDDGAGFSPERALIPGTSSGLSNMRERADLLGGKLEIESSSGAGTCVTAELPLDHLA